MIARSRVVVVVAVGIVLLGGAAAYCVAAVVGYQSTQSGRSTVRATTVTAHGDEGTLVFRSTAAGPDYGHVASVPLDDPRSQRIATELTCDRVYAGQYATVCLRIDRGILTTFSATLIGDEGAQLATWPLPGIPSRARISPDGDLVAFTSFVSGQAYATVGFSTATQVATIGTDGTPGTDYGNIEGFALLVDGQQVTAIDRNIWGVTFTDDDDVFYATAASGGTTWLVRGDLAERTLTAVRENAECPSVSPDGTRVAYKKNVSDTATAYWSIAVLDLATGDETVLPDERDVDDQVEWSDDHTLLYGMPRTDAVGDSDVWSIAADGSADPRLLVEHAWSPSVVRP